MMNLINKRIFYKFILFALLIIFLFELETFAVSDFSYELDASNNAIITAYNGTDGDILIPNIINDYNVLTIGEHAFDENRNDTNGSILTNVTISSGITTVDDYAFVDCTNLESITLPDSLTSLGDFTFLNCKKLSNINIPSNLKTLGMYVLQETGFTKFTIPDGFELIKTAAFRSCDHLKSFLVYSNDVVYEDNVFEYCPDDLVLYGYEGSTTQAYAQQNGLTFKLLSEYEDEIDDTDVPVTSLSLNKTSLSLNIGDIETLTATVSPDDATDKSIVWSSSDTSVATVENGKITAVSVGTATITAESADGSVTASCSVTVSEKSSDSSDPNSVNNSAVPKNNTTNSAFSNYTGTITRLPNAGISSILLIILLVLLILVPIIYKYYRNLRKID